MNQKTFNTVAGTIFLIVALVHLWRALTQTPIEISTTIVPVWVSWIAVIVAATMSYQGLRKRR
jgi:hypothetical protein